MSPQLIKGGESAMQFRKLVVFQNSANGFTGPYAQDINSLEDDDELRR